MVETTAQTAIWTPGWYELDQTLVLQERRKFWFFESPPEGDSDSESVDLVFYNQLDSDKNCIVRYARVLEMFHPSIGFLQRIDTDGLDYIFVSVDGGETVVNAEEDPGTIYDGSLPVDDWSVFVKLGEVSDPMSDACHPNLA